MQIKSFWVMIAFCLVTILGGMSPQSEPVQPSVLLPPELARVLTDYENAWAGKNAAALADLFVEDGFVLSPGHSMVRGKHAIEELYGGPKRAGGLLFLRAVAYAETGNVGYIIGGFTNQAGTPDRGKFTLTLRRNSSGRWLIVSDMDNGNQNNSPITAP